MKTKQTVLWTAATVGLLTVFACVTINIYFPADKVESVVAKALNIDPAQIDRIAAIFAKEWQKPVR